jgi:uncharacterized protein YkwD
MTSTRALSAAPLAGAAIALSGALLAASPVALAARPHRARGHGAACTDTNLIPTSANTARVAAATLCLVNAQRVLAGERPLSDNGKLAAAAAGHSRDMVSADYFDHNSPTGVTPLDRIRASGYLPSGHPYQFGENIAVGTLQFATPAATVSEWMKSPDHRANILGADFVASGIGVVAQAPSQYSAGDGGATYTQDFGVVQAQ